VRDRLVPTTHAPLDEEELGNDVDVAGLLRLRPPIDVERRRIVALDAIQISALRQQTLG
jgi:hypothetical protein